MTIVLTANNLRDLADGYTLKKGKILFDILVALNILNVIFSLAFSVGFSFLELSGNNHSQPEQKQFWFVTITYIAAVLMGLNIQIGGGLDGYSS